MVRAGCNWNDFTAKVVRVFVPAITCIAGSDRLSAASAHSFELIEEIMALEQANEEVGAVTSTMEVFKDFCKTQMPIYFAKQRLM